MNAAVKPTKLIDALLKHWALWAFRDQSSVRGLPHQSTLTQIQVLQLVEHACTARGKQTRNFRAPEIETDVEAERVEAALIRLRGYSTALAAVVLAEYAHLVPIIWGDYTGRLELCRQRQFPDGKFEAAPLWRARILKALGMGQRSYEDRLRRSKDYLSALLL